MGSIDPNLGRMLNEYQSYNLEKIGFIGFENSSIKSFPFFLRHRRISFNPYSLFVKFLKPNPTVIKSNVLSLKGRVSPLS
ncbi:MAG: hypothetical protein Ct9H90mP22_3590 [Gammaproteobacteria bacterium]|nr:MAG: hypothetical protein Ct9H90mP22_3590 [Gammaproteobacteria bacterium]